MGYLAVMIGTALCVATRKLPGVVVLSVVLDSPENEHILASTFLTSFLCSSSCRRLSYPHARLDYFIHH